jgi:hypothetical protein
MGALVIPHESPWKLQWSSGETAGLEAITPFAQDHGALGRARTCGDLPV